MKGYMENWDQYKKMIDGVSLFSYFVISKFKKLNFFVIMTQSAFKELCFETTVDFKGGEFCDGEEAAVSLRYEIFFGFCKLCGSLCHKEELCPLDEKNTKASPERRREIREGIGGWSDGTKHEERARSYKGVVINGHTGQQHKERESREYYGKGKAKMVDAAR